MLKIKKGDHVRVISGADRGKEGIVEKLFPKKGTAFVPGVGMYKKHVKPQVARDGKGGIYELFRPIAVNKLAIVDSKSNKPTRIRFQMKDNKKIRVSTKGLEITQTK